jgi:hypothetical protein
MVLICLQGLQTIGVRVTEGKGRWISPLVSASRGQLTGRMGISPTGDDDNKYGAYLYGEV